MNPLSDTNFISIELSNLCQYRNIHNKCPLFLEKDKPADILPSEIIYDILNTLKKYSFKGSLRFHTYNEPLVDDRLIHFITYSKNECGLNSIEITTNGLALNQEKLDELTQAGVTSVTMSVYFPKEKERIQKLHFSIPIIFYEAGLDNRLDIYERKEENYMEKCTAPLNEIIITRDGKISLCCADWKRMHVFCDLTKQSFEDALKNEELIKIYKELTIGNRSLNLCRRCPGGR